MTNSVAAQATTCEAIWLPERQITARLTLSPSSALGALESAGENAPGVGLDLDMLASIRMVATPCEQRFHIAARRTQGRRRLRIQRNVEMHARLDGTRDFNGIQEIRQVHETGDSGRFSEHQHLMEISRLVECADGFDCRWIAWIQNKRAGKMDLGNANAGIPHGLQRRANVIVFEGEMTGVEVHADPAPQDFRIGSFRVQSLEKIQRFPRVFKMSARFRLQPEVEIVTRFLR